VHERTHSHTHSNTHTHTLSSPPRGSRQKTRARCLPAAQSHSSRRPTCLKVCECKGVCMCVMCTAYVHCITLHYTTSHYTTLHCISLHYIILHLTTLHYTTHYAALHYTILHYTTLHFTRLHLPVPMVQGRKLAAAHFLSRSSGIFLRSSHCEV
jgi:hypothetical protein